MSRDNRQPTVIRTGAGSGPAWFIAAVSLIAAVVASYFLVIGKTESSKEINVKIELPKPAAHTNNGS